MTTNTPAPPMPATTRPAVLPRAPLLVTLLASGLIALLGTAWALAPEAELLGGPPERTPLGLLLGPTGAASTLAVISLLGVGAALTALARRLPSPALLTVAAAQVLVAGVGMGSMSTLSTAGYLLALAMPAIAGILVVQVMRRYPQARPVVGGAVVIALAAGVLFLGGAVLDLAGYLLPAFAQEIPMIATTLLLVAVGALWGGLGAAALALLIGAAAALAWWPLGAGLARLAPHLLGPTAADRLEAAEQRVARESERTRIARELHDGIGHALTVVSVQAAAARTVQHRDPEAAAAALAAIEETARGATGELDAVLALLREEERGRQAPRRPAPHGAAAPTSAAGPHGPAAPTSAAAPHGPAAPNGAVTPYRSAAPGRTASPSSAASPDRSDAGTDSAPADDLETLLASHRRAGMDLRRRGRLPADLAPLERRHLLRGLGEMLADAQRHAADGPVDLALSADGERVRVEVTSPPPVGPGEPEASAAPALPVGPDRPAYPAYPARPTHADSPDHPDHVDRPDHVDHPDLAVASADLSASSGGRGLVGLRERAALLGGVLEAGPQGESWVARLDLPLLREEER